MNAVDFALLGLHYRYQYLQARGKKLITLQEPGYLVHIYALDGFYAELCLDPVKYSIISVEPFDEKHPKYNHYMKKLDALSAA